MNDMQKYINILTESQMIREYGNVGWNWFTNDKRIFVRAWQQQDIKLSEIKQFIAELEYEADTDFEDYWHPMEGYIPGGSDSRQLKKMIKQIEQAQPADADDDENWSEFGNHTGYGYNGDEEIEVIVLVGDIIASADSYNTTWLDGAVSHGKLAVWYGDNTTWF